MLRRVSVCVAGALFLLSVRNARADDVDDDNWRPDVLRCEEAVKKLVACCPDFDASSVMCTYEKVESGGCEIPSTMWVRPAYDERESACVLAASCDELIATDVCRRAVASAGVQPPSSTHAPVCP